ELADLYAAAVDGTPPGLPPLEFQYLEFTAWQRDAGRDSELAAAMEYWKNRLRDAPPALELPTDRPRSGEQHYRGGWLWREVGKRQAEALRALGRAHGCTLYMVLLGAFDVLLHRYSGQTDLLVGTPVAGRERAEFDALIGLFVNTVVLRIDLSGDLTFSGLLAHVREVTLDAQAHQRLPFEKLVEALRPDRTLSHAPVFQIMFNMTPIPDRKADAGGVEFSMGRLLDHGVSTFDLTLSVGEHADGLELVYEYDTDLFDRATIERMAAHYAQLLVAVLEDPDRPASCLPMLTAGETRRLAGTREPGATAQTPTVIELFERHAGRQARKCAVIDGEERIAYGALDRRANRLANQLIEPEQRVAVCLERSIDTIVAILAVHKSGCAYVPLDPDYPSRRIADMLAKASPDAVVTRARFCGLFTGADEQRRIVVQLDLEAASIAAQSPDPPGIEARADMPAYILFTSGSAGMPKGVIVSHANLASAFSAWSSAYELSSGDRHLQMAGLAFDVYTGDWVRALCSGAGLVICPKSTLLDPAALQALLRDQRITVAEFVPAISRGLVRQLQHSRQDLGFMRLIVVGSDTWFGAECNDLVRFAGANVRVVNSYGVAEATIDSTSVDASAAPRRRRRTSPSANPSPTPASTSAMRRCGRSRSACPVSCALRGRGSAAATSAIPS
ncbi:MAG: condensation domain-containing protein, partial [Gammaproteobacteria bacterium]